MPDKYEHLRSQPFPTVALALGWDVSKFKTRKGGQEHYSPCHLHGSKPNQGCFSYATDGSSRASPASQRPGRTGSGQGSPISPRHTRCWMNPTSTVCPVEVDTPLRRHLDESAGPWTRITFRRDLAKLCH